MTTIRDRRPFQWTKLHGNAPFGPKGRATMVRRVTERHWSLAEVGEAAGVSERTAGKWVKRYREEGEAGLRDRSSAPSSVPNRIPEDRGEAIAALQRCGWPAPRSPSAWTWPSRPSPRSGDGPTAHR